tara:strand:- start:74 stop:283 length:210 start_codon:yes stop_codon:yes gene_type:complete
MSLYCFWSYLLAFSTIIVECGKPVNWDNCWPPQEWLVPAVHDYMRAKNPYSEERKILEMVERKEGDLKN